MADKPRGGNRNPRAAAALAVADVLRGQSLAESLPRRSAAVAEKDRALVSELAFGTCRWYPRLQAITAQLLQRPLKLKDSDIQALLLLGLQQLLNTRVPAHAAVAETTEATRALGKGWATKLVNASLRRFQREREQLLEAADAHEDARHAQPAWLLKGLQDAWPDHWQAICTALQQHPPMTLRVNARRSPTADYARQLTAAGIAAQPVSGLPEALMLDKPLDVTRLPGFEEGLVSVQDAGAQLAAHLLDAQPGQRVLDACAAPGGKTCHLLERIPDLDMTALDVDPQRLERVQQNLDRLHLQARLVAADAASPAGEWTRTPYHRILLDAPCSATGVIRRHPDIKLLRRAADIAALAARQAALLDALWPLLEHGGKLLYVTCSLMPMENEQQIEAFLQRQPEAVALPLPDHWGHVRGPGRQTLPGEQGMDGFFYALLEKPQ